MKHLSRLRFPCSLAQAATLACAIAMSAGLQAQADPDLIAHEPFDYAPIQEGTDSNLNPTGGIEGLSGGTGFAGGWDDLIGTITFGTGNRATGVAGIGGFPSGNRTTALEYSDPSGNVLETSGQQARTSFGSRSVAGRQLNTSYGSDGDTLWLSFLGQSFDSNGGNRWAGFALGDNNGYIGRPINSGNWGFIGAGSPLIDTGIPAGTAVFFVARIDFQPGVDDLAIWIDPALDAEPTLDTAAATGSVNLSSFDTVLMAGRYSTDFDEFRLGRSFASVTPLVTSNISALVDFGATWKYLDDGSDQGTAWTLPGFADGSWASGTAQLGYGDGDEATTLSFGPDSNAKFPTTYFRHTFNVADTSGIGSLIINLIRDDGAIVYLNGTELARSNMPSGVVDYLTPAASVIFGSSETAVNTFVVPASSLVTGDNTIAVEVHQVNGSSSDISFDLQLLPSSEVIPVPTVTVSSSGNLSEDTWGNSLLTLNLDQPLPGSLAVTVAIGGSASAADWFSIPDESLTTIEVPAGQTSVSYQIWANDDEVAEPTETLTFSILKTSPFYELGTPSTTTIDIVENPEDAWRAANFLGDANDPAVAGEEANVDGDRLTTRLERLFGRDPLLSDGNFIDFALVNDQNELEVRFPWFNATDSERFVPRLSRDLKSWVPATQYTLSESISGDLTMVTLTLPTRLPSPADNPFSGTHLGTPLFPTAWTYNALEKTLSLSVGGRDIGGTLDEGFFAYQEMTGDGEILARIVSQENSSTNAKAGLMIRESIEQGARSAFVRLTPENGAGFQRRLTTDGPSSFTAGSTGVSAPRWLRLVRNGDQFSAYESSDGSNWDLIAAETIPMSSDSLIGIAACSDNVLEQSTVAVDSIELN